MTAGLCGAAEDFQWGAVEDAAVGDEAGDDGGGADTDEGDDHREEGELEFSVENVAGEEPRAGFGEDDASEGGECAEQEVFGEEDAVHLLAGGAEGAEENGFLNALVATGHDGRDEDDKAGDDGEEGHELNDEGDFFEDGIQRVEHEGEIDDGDVGVSADDGALHGG